MKDFKIDASTGLPALPEGKIWAVKFCDSDDWDLDRNGYLRVTIRHKGRFKNWYENCIATLVCSLTDDDGSPIPFERYPALVLWLAGEVMAKYGRELTKEMWLAEQTAVTEKLNGLYPPKRLDVND